MALLHMSPVRELKFQHFCVEHNLQWSSKANQPGLTSADEVPVEVYPRHTGNELDVGGGGGFSLWGFVFSIQSWMRSYRVSDQSPVRAPIRLLHSPDEEQFHAGPPITHLTHPPPQNPSGAYPRKPLAPGSGHPGPQKQSVPPVFIKVRMAPTLVGQPPPEDQILNQRPLY